MTKHLMIVMALVIGLGFVTLKASAEEMPGEYVDDSVITTRVESLLAADDLLKSFQIRVETKRNIVQMSGYVDSQRAVDRAIQIARSVNGVHSVKNSLIVK